MLSPGDQATNPVPDFVARYRYEANQWHMQISSLYRAIGYNDGQRTQTIFGWGLNGSNGWQVLKNNAQGNANRIQFSAKYDRYRRGL